MKQKAGDLEVKVEHKTPAGGFGSSLPRETMKFSKFLEAIESQKGSDLYLTTQYRDEDDEEDDLDDGIFVQMLHEYCPPPLPPMIKSFPHRPALLGNLVPQQVNIWIGNSADGTSSGLHHDFHDNLYLLLQGRKRFTLFSPADANNLYTHGKVKKVHKNGLVNYANREATRSDGASEADVAQHKVDSLETALENLEEAEGAATEREAIEKELAAAKDALLDLEDHFDEENDDFDEMMDDMLDGSDFEDESDELSEEEPKKKRGASNNHKDNGATKKGAKTNGKKAAIISDDEEDDEEDGEDDDLDLLLGLDGEKEEPNSFSKIPPAELHHPTADTRKKYPLLSNAVRCSVDIGVGEMLFLPSGWFHEVTSFSDASASSKAHVAFNYWMHPPATKTFSNPYEDTYWQSQWKEMEDLILDIDDADRSGKRPIALEEEMSEEEEFAPAHKKRKD